VTRRHKPQVYWRESGSGPPLVLLNGWSASGLAWPRAWVRELGRTFRVIRIDNRGTGYSRFADTPYTIPDLADDVAAVLDAAEFDRATVAGMSMGGMIAQEFAFRHHERLDALVLIATRPPAPAYAVPKASGMLLDLLGPRRRNEPLTTYFTRLWASSTGPGYAEREPELLAEMVAQIVARPTPRGTLIEQLRAVSGWGHAERLAKIDVPTVVVHGAEDQLVHVLNGRRLGNLIPGAHYTELAGVGHLPPLEAPEQTLDLIVDVAAREPLARAAVPA
jgi:3-oxoadipate enol-lactonase